MRSSSSLKDPKPQWLSNVSIMMVGLFYSNIDLLV